MNNACLTKQLITALLLTIGFSFYQTFLYGRVNSTLEDSTSIEQHIKRGAEFLASNPEKAITQFDTAITFSRKIDWHNKAATSFLYQAFAYRAMRKKVEMLAACDSAYHYYVQEDNVPGKIDVLYNKGSFLVEFEEFKQGAEELETAIEISLLTNDFQRQAKAYTNAGIARQYLGQNKLAFQHHLAAARLKERNNLPGINRSYVNVGVALFEQGDHREAILYFKKALALSKAANDSSVETLAYKNIGSGFSELQLLDSSSFYFGKALQLQRLAHDTLAYANTLLSFGINYLHLQNFKEAKLYLDSALLLGSPYNNQRFLSTLYLHYSNLYLSLSGNNKTFNDSALLYANKSLQAGEENQTLPKVILAKENLVKIHEHLGDFESALDYSKELYALKDSIKELETSTAFVEARELYKAENRELEINLLKQTNRTKELEIETVEQEKASQRIALVSAGTFLLLSVLGLVLLYRQYTQKNKAFHELEDSNEIIKKQAEEKELLLKEIHHRVKNNLQIIHSLLDIQRSKYTSAESKDTVQESQHRIKAMALIHEKLYENNDLKTVLFEDYATELIQQIQRTFKEYSDVSVNVTADKKNFDIDTIVPLGLMLSELITNSFKYAFPEKEGLIEINLSEHADKGRYVLLIKDSGKEFNFQESITKPKSIGLKLVQRLAKQLKGDLNYEYDNGSVFKIEFKG